MVNLDITPDTSRMDLSVTHLSVSAAAPRVQVVAAAALPGLTKAPVQCT
jgi:hypothetical protein